MKISAAMFIFLSDCFLTTLLLPCNHGVQRTQTNDFLLFFTTKWVHSDSWGILIIICQFKVIYPIKAINYYLTRLLCRLVYKWNNVCFIYKKFLISYDLKNHWFYDAGSILIFRWTESEFLKIATTLWVIICVNCCISEQ